MGGQHRRLAHLGNPTFPRRAERVRPHGNWQATIFIAALRVDRSDVPCVSDGLSTGESFPAYVDLVHRARPANIVNLVSHMSPAALTRP